MKGKMMKKLIVMTAVTALLAIGCASRKNQGGAGNENNPSYVTGTTESSGTMDKNANKGATQLQNNGTGTINTNAPSSSGPADNGTGVAPGTGSGTAPGGTNSGSSQNP